MRSNESAPSYKGNEDVRMLVTVWQSIKDQIQPDGTIGELFSVWFRAFESGLAKKDPWTGIVCWNHLPETRRQLSKSDIPDLTVELKQLAVSRYLGFDSFAALDASPETRLNSIFESAVEMAIDGQLEELKLLMEANPELVRERSRLGHKATLLHYISANGVEIHRQRIPENAEAIAGYLIGLSDHPDVECSIYGGGPASTPLCLVISSGHLVDNNIQIPIMKLLLKHGAAVDGIRSEGSPLETAVSFEYKKAEDLLLENGAKTI